MIVVTAASFNKFRSIKTKKYGLHLIRGTTGILAFTCYVICIRKTNIVDGTLLLNTTPLFIPFVALIWLKKKFDNFIWFGILTGFVGIVLIIHPVTGDFLKAGEIFGVMSGVFLAVAFVAMKELSVTESFEAIIFYYSSIATLISLPVAAANWVNPPLIIWVYGILTGVTFMLFIYLLQYAYRFEEASKLSPFNFSAVVYTLIFNVIFFHQKPDFITVLGIILVSIGGIMAIKIHSKSGIEYKHHWHF
ncbi:MAG: DMT family transporter [Bacteroidetes bacterium]|nr:DMT family transporter [Bacteroidota bacterium]